MGKGTESLCVVMHIITTPKRKKISARFQIFSGAAFFSVLLLGTVNLGAEVGYEELKKEPPTAQIENSSHALLYLNAVVLASRWNNMVVYAKRGDEQLALMAKSGVFSKDVRLSFDFGNEKLSFRSLSDPKAIEFYNGFVNSLKKSRFNFAANVEPIRIRTRLAQVPVSLPDFLW